MLARRESDCQAVQWKQELGRAITCPEELLDFLGLDPELLPAARAAGRRFSLLVPRGYAALMERSNPDDPLLRQVLPLGEELRELPGFCADPLAEQAAVRAPGLLQKFPSRALLLLTGACAIHCRYCFRRQYPYAESSIQPDRGAGAFRLLTRDSSIREVILSGGDPLMTDDSAIARLITKLEAIPHLQRLRLHTRIPIVLPSRVTPALCRTLSASRLRPIVVVHTNHPRELGAASRIALQRLHNAGILLLNQSVLLRGVNDDASCLAELCETLFDCSVLPYYLHLLDKVSGAAHFDLDETKAIRILKQLRTLLPGYLVPRLVREIAGEAYKIPIEQRDIGWNRARTSPLVVE